MIEITLRTKLFFLFFIEDCLRAGVWLLHNPCLSQQRFLHLEVRWIWMKAYKQSIVDNGHLGALSNLCVLALTKSCEIGRVCSLLTEWTNVIKVVSVFPFSCSTICVLRQNITECTIEFWTWRNAFETHCDILRAAGPLRESPFPFQQKRWGHRSVRLWLLLLSRMTQVPFSVRHVVFALFCAGITGPCRLLAYWLVFERPCRLMSSQLESWLALSLIYLTLCYLAILVTLRVCWIAW